ncbi:MAG: hypothetical protein IMF07_05610, partial [Proteobacteria bacterium]|nr:hypothetical protein [Pseudomonadota bacterium]
MNHYAKSGIGRLLSLGSIKFSLILALSVSPILSGAYANAGTFTAFGPKDFTRGNGKPAIESAAFNIKNPDTAYTLNIYNGGDGSEYKKVSSAIIELNNNNLFGTKDFKQKTTLLKKQVGLSSSNKLEVELRSIPDSGLTILIEGEDSSAPEITILSPISDTYLNTPSITVSGTADDSISWVETVSVNGVNAN